MVDDPKMLPAPEHPASGGTPFTVFDYLGLAFILEPPGVLVHAVMTGEPLKWKNALYALPFIAVGAACIFIGRNWQTLKQKFNNKIVVAIDKLSKSYLVPFIVGMFILSGITVLPIFIWPPVNSTTTATPADSRVAASIAPKPIPDDIETLVGTLRSQLNSTAEKLRQTEHELKIARKPLVSPRKIPTWLELEFDFEGKPIETASTNIVWAWWNPPESSRLGTIQLLQSSNATTLIFLSFVKPIEFESVALKASSALPAWESYQKSDKAVVIWIHGTITNSKLSIEVIR